MVCPFCLHKKTNVYNSRTTQKINEVWRRRRCLACNREFTTRERAQADSVIKVRCGKKAIPFLQSRLLLSLLKASDHRKDDETIFYIVEAVQQRLYALAANQSQLVTPEQIAHSVRTVLENFDPIAYIKYTAQTQSATELAHLIKKATKKTTS